MTPDHAQAAAEQCESDLRIAFKMSWESDTKARLVRLFEKHIADAIRAATAEKEREIGRLTKELALANAFPLTDAERAAAEELAEAVKEFMSRVKPIGDSSVVWDALARWDAVKANPAPAAPE